jgi:hypothetical protein
MAEGRGGEIVLNCCRKGVMEWSGVGMIVLVIVGRSALHSWCQDVMVGAPVDMRICNE